MKPPTWMLKAEINSLEERIQQLKKLQADGGASAREFQGEGNRQYLTGLKLGGNRIAILGCVGKHVGA